MRIFEFHQSTHQSTTLGRMKGLGIDGFHELPLLFPRKYQDVRRQHVSTDFSKLQHRLGEKVFIGCKLVGQPLVKFDAVKKLSTTDFTISDRHGFYVNCRLFGGSRDFITKLKARPVFCLQVTVDDFRGNLQFKSINWVDMKWVGRIMPIYPGKTKYISPDTVREKMLDMMDMAIPQCLDYLHKQFFIKTQDDEIRLLKSVGSNQKTLLDLIKQLHLPPTIEQGEMAQTIWRRLAAKYLLDTAEKSIAQKTVKKSAIDISNALLQQVISEMPSKYRLTYDQEVATRDIIDDIRSARPMNRLLSGDVGTGKSIPISIAAAAIARAGKNAVILMPNESLAEQLRRDIAEWWPDTDPKLVGGSIKGLPDSRILVGTTALNHRIKKDYLVDLLIIDEQHKHSSAQRLKLARRYTNVLEASATPIPMIMGRVKFTGMEISVLREAYIDKTIHTHLTEGNPEDKQGMFMHIRDIVAQGSQALIIYPLADTKDEEKEKKSAEKAFSAWEKFFPGRVRFMHGRLKTENKLASIDALKKGMLTFYVAQPRLKLVSIFLN
nr:DEAD/DEAH box helicase family protein [Methylomarinum sp. Ch1-1]MDP4523283.1 DEAD/DEAH box helicase family protein [Methylomarinum sp. Ch1-1]